FGLIFLSTPPTSRSTCRRCVAHCVTAGTDVGSSSTSAVVATASSPQSMRRETRAELKWARHPQFRGRAYFGRDDSRAAVHCCEDSDQFVDLRHPRLAGDDPGPVRELLAPA